MEKRLVGLFCILFLLLVSCNIKEKKNICNSDIKDIQVLYSAGLSTGDVATRCEDLLRWAEESKKRVNNIKYVPYLPFIDTLITDCSIIEQIEYEINNFQPIENRLIDARMLVYVNYKNGDVDKICINGVPVRDIIYNGQFQYNNKFLYLIKLYSGFYDWIPKSEFSYMDELNDTTFVREKMKNRWGEEY